MGPGPRAWRAFSASVWRGGTCGHAPAPASHGEGGSASQAAAAPACHMRSPAVGPGVQVRVGAPLDLSTAASAFCTPVGKESRF